MTSDKTPDPTKVIAYLEQTMLYVVVDKLDGHIWYVSNAFHKAYYFWLNKKGCSLELF